MVAANWHKLNFTNQRNEMYNSQAWVDWLPHICLLFSGFSNVCHSACVWPTALKLGCIANFDMLSLVMWFISLVDEIQFMLIGSRHICIRSISSTLFNHVPKQSRPKLILVTPDAVCGQRWRKSPSCQAVAQHPKTRRTILGVPRMLDQLWRHPGPIIGHFCERIYHSSLKDRLRKYRM